MCENYNFTQKAYYYIVAETGIRYVVAKLQNYDINVTKEDANIKTKACKLK